MEQRNDTLSLVFISIMFMLMYSFPMLGIANKATLKAGFPLMFIYMFGVWIVLIGITIYRFEFKNRNKRKNQK
jgi:hypothetical protein